MDWTEITLRIDASFSEDASAIMQMVSNGIYIEDYRNIEQAVYEISHTDLIDEGLLQKDRENVIIHAYFNAFENLAEKTGYITERLDGLSTPYELKESKIRDEDWENNWKKYYKPFAVGNRLVIKPMWEELGELYGREYKGRAVLNIEPGLAFGTGTHESTRMCLELLEDAVRCGCSVLDIGCGSGILSIAALLLGAETAVAVDIDPLAVRSTKQNGALNGFSDDRLTALEGNLVDKLESCSKFDIIVANIIADVIIGVSSAIPQYMKQNGAFICSGIIDEKLNRVKKELEVNGFVIQEIREEKGWAAIFAKRRG